MTKRALWLDDKIGTDALRSLIDVLASAGFAVTGTATVEEAAAVIEHQAFDLILVDLRIPDSRQTGIDFLRLLARRFAESERKPCVIACSAHLGQLSYRAHLGLIPYPVYVLDKGRLAPTPAEAPSPAEVFLECVSEALDLTSDSDAAEFLKDNDKYLVDLNPMTITLEKYRKLTFAEQSLLHTDGRYRCAPDFDLLVKGEDIDWAVYCGDATNPVSKGRRGDIPPSDLELEDLMIAKNRLAYYLSRDPGYAVEDIRMHCKGGMADYPRFDLRLDGAAVPRSVHFDTGSDAAFFQAADILDAELPLPEVCRSFRGDGGWYTMFKLGEFSGKILLNEPHDGETMIVKVKDAFAIRDWECFPHSRPCGPRSRTNPCELGEATGFCRNRDALVGRHFLAHNKLAATLTGDSPDIEWKRLDE